MTLEEHYTSRVLLVENLKFEIKQLKAIIRNQAKQLKEYEIRIKNK